MVPPCFLAAPMNAVLDLGETLSIAAYEKLWKDKLESVFPMKAGTQETVPTISYTQRPQQAPAYKHLKPKAVIPMHWGTFPVLAKDTSAFASHLASVAPDVRLVSMKPGDSAAF